MRLVVIFADGGLVNLDEGCWLEVVAEDHGEGKGAEELDNASFSHSRDNRPRFRGEGFTHSLDGVSKQGRGLIMAPGNVRGGHDSYDALGSTKIPGNKQLASISSLVS